jgi:UDP-N-acetylglucosamine--N-acetylmuramyl-(pentapeptide) pyrophosphoryl-undecaprenol N-acetylglucosamine transferase
LAKSVSSICTAYDGLDRFFPKEKIVLTGNPVRREMVNIDGKKEEAYSCFGLNPNKKTILVVGGSLGARTLNESVLAAYDGLTSSNVQVLWQCGKLYFESISEKLKGKEHPQIKFSKFIDRMDLAYAMADVVISRAGAISVSELCLIAKPVILVPSPNVAEDHQTHNAMALVNNGAALLVKDVSAVIELIPSALKLIEEKQQCRDLSVAIQKMGKPMATEHIVDEIERIVK